MCGPCPVRNPMALTSISRYILTSNAVEVGYRHNTICRVHGNRGWAPAGVRGNRESRGALMPAVIEAYEAAESAVVSPVVARQGAGRDLVLIDLSGVSPAAESDIRRVLRGSEDVCEVTVIRRTCRVLLDAGAAPRLLRALAARGLPIAVVTVAVQGAEPRPEDAAVADQWQQAETSPRQALTPSRTATAASATATAGSTHHQPMVFNPRPASTPPAM